MHVLNHTYNNFLHSFCIVGINYRKTEMSIRNRFSLSQESSIALLQEAVSKKIPGCMVLSTCNRTEIYGLCNSENDLINLFSDNTHTNLDELLAHSYTFRGLDAIGHLFKVASGLDSQIIGDFEILSQLKQSFQTAKDYGCINSFMERAVNYALQVSKEIKTKTKLSTGTVSVSYAAIEIIRETIPDVTGKKILLAGTGKFGSHIAKNLKSYLAGAHIFFTNRTDKKASTLAKKYDAAFIPYEKLPLACNDADIIITSSTADSYIIFPTFLVDEKPRLILDLSVPQNVDPAVTNLPQTTLLNVDQVSVILNKTIEKRKKEIPKALKIIDFTLNSLQSWHTQQANNPLLVKVKSQLYELNKIHFKGNNSEEKIHKTVSSLAINLKHKNNKGCQCIHALNSYLQLNYEEST